MEVASEDTAGHLQLTHDESNSGTAYTYVSYQGYNSRESWQKTDVN